MKRYFVVGFVGLNYPLAAFWPEEEIAEFVETHPKMIWFVADTQGTNMDEDLEWFSDKPGPDWVTDIEKLEVLV